MTGTDERFAELRRLIEESDRAVVEAVNVRLRLVEELWRLKAEQGAARLDPERERRLREELRASNPGPLSNEGLDRLVGELLELTKRELGGDV
ncbi:MAG TPA: chorismate mutase [Gaiella sp.]|jgi:3-deoxy-7-phosphoheptulonate synthase/chorismate mutase|nr:chorismate mutase [Gaiella sp.]